jgi:3-deoxy-7-phosphoheptulonate synthase
MRPPVVITVSDPAHTDGVMRALAQHGVAATGLAPTKVFAPDGLPDGDDGILDGTAGVVGVAPSPPWPLASTLLGPPKPVPVGGAAVGGKELFVIAGPCAVESAEQLSLVGDAVRRVGAHALRGGAFKPRTSPYSFQGLGRDGLALLRAYKARTGHLVVTEVMDPADVDAVADVADVLQVGARNMQNAPLLHALGRSRRPVLLKRGFGASANELLHSAEYILAGGNMNVILCERGIRTHETSTRFTLDVGAIAWLKQRSRLPVIVDPSHAAGHSALVAPLAMAGIAAGADGVIIEVHDDPAHAKSDGDQALTEDAFAALMTALRPLAHAVHRSLPERPQTP